MKIQELMEMNTPPKEVKFTSDAEYQQFWKKQIEYENDMFHVEHVVTTDEQGRNIAYDDAIVKMSGSHPEDAEFEIVWYGYADPEENDWAAIEGTLYITNEREIWKQLEAQWDEEAAL